MWSGGARGHNRGGGWHDFVLDRVEFDNAKPYFEKQTNTRFRALKSGYFTYDIDYMSHANHRCWSHFQFLVNGQKVNGNNHMYVYSWREMQYRITWYIKKGQTFWGKAYISGCGNEYRWHGAGDWKGAYNCIQVTY